MNGDTPLVSNPKWNSFRDEFRRRGPPGNMRAKQFSPQQFPPMPDLFDERPDPNTPAARLVGIEPNPGPSDRKPLFSATASRTFVITTPLCEICLNVIVAAFLSSIDFNLRRFFNIYPDDGLVITGSNTVEVSFNSNLFTSFIREYRHSCVHRDPQISLLLDGDVEPNPGPPTNADDDTITPVTVQPSRRRPPSHRQSATLTSDCSDFFMPRTERPLHLDSSTESAPCQPASRASHIALQFIDQVALHSDDSIDSMHVHLSAAVLNDSDSSLTSDPDLHPIISSIHDVGTLELLPPPKFVGFLVPSTAQVPPPDHSATICAVDTMCLGEFSIISFETVNTLRLPTTPFQRTSRTATGAIVKCSSRADFFLMLFSHGTWRSYPVKALVWEATSQPLLLCNTWALQCGLIDLVQPNPVRCSLFGSICFCWREWESLIQQHNDDAIDTYHIDVMTQSDDEMVDLSASTRVGDQDVSLLPEDARAMAALFPVMTKALPFHAHPDLEKWRAHVVIENLANYSWPKSALLDLKEDKLPLRAIPAIHVEFDKLIAQGFAEHLSVCPTSVVMRAQLVSKSKTEKRFCVNGSVQKNILRVGVYPMPSIRNIFAFVAKYPWRAKVDLKWGYYNFEIHEDDRKWTTTIGGGRAIQWRKLVQGFASSGAFFQYAMTKLLGPEIVGVIAEVYLDDLIIVGRTKADCERNVITVMTKLAAYNFRVNFSKCQFTPSTSIDFLGCRLIENVVHPGPKVSTMLEKIKPFYLQHTPKAQRHHLHVFLGMCAYLLQHCKGLKEALHLLYLCVASEPFRFGDAERSTFDRCRLMLCALDVYHLPSDEPGIVLEVHSDASGGAGSREDPGHWGAVLGQRLNVDVPVHTEGFQLLQLDGGSFNERQARWDILKKECWALYRAIKQFRYYLFGRFFRIIVDSKVLMHMHRSSVPMIQRWYSYIQSHDFVLIHFSSENNGLADALTRCTVIPPAPRLVGVEPNPGPLEEYLVVSSDTSVSSISYPSDDDEPIVNAVTRSGLATAPPQPKLRPAAKSGPASPLPSPLRGPAAAATPVKPRTPRAAAPTATAQIRAPASPAPAAPTATAQIRAPASPAPVLQVPTASASPAIAGSAAPAPHASASPSKLQPPTPEQSKHSSRRRKLEPPKVTLAAPANEATAHQPVAVSPAPNNDSERVYAVPHDVDPPPSSRPGWPSLLGHNDDRDDSAPLPRQSASIVSHRCSPSTSSFFLALSAAMENAEYLDRLDGIHVNDPCPSHSPTNCRDSVMAWMRKNALSHQPILLNETPFEYRLRMYDPASTYVLYFRDSHHRPRTWLEYIDMLQHHSTEADELVMLCAATCFRCQILISIPNGLTDVTTKVFSPPHPFRQVHLLFFPDTRHFNWCHDPAILCCDTDACEASGIVTTTFVAPPALGNAHVRLPSRVHLNDDPDIAEQRLAQIAAAHCGHTGHPGVQATLAILREQQHTWRGMTAQVAQFIRRCATCNLARIHLNPAVPATASIRLGARPLRRWHCDQTGTLTRCAFTGFERIITFVCEATGYTVCAGSRHGSALEIAIALVFLAGTYGSFESFHSDNGPENDAFIIHQFCRLSGIRHTASIPNNPQTNGLVERAIQNVKRFLRCMISDGITSHNSWGLMLPMVQKAINSSPFGPLQVPPNAVIFASLYCPDNYIIPCFFTARTQDDFNTDLADGNHYNPAANFVHRASYFQQNVNNCRQEIYDSAFITASAEPLVEPEDIPIGSQVLIPWNSDRRPTSLHPYRRGPYVVVSSEGNVLFLQHACYPVPDSQAPSIRWSAAAQIFTLEVPLLRHSNDPSAVNVPAAAPIQRPIDAVLDFALKPEYMNALYDQRYDVRNQLFRCRIFAQALTSIDTSNWTRVYSYEEIKHTLAFETFSVCHPFLHGHTPIANMPAHWNPVSARAVRPMHVPDIEAERHLPMLD